MNERPIIFSAPMVRAILEGRKAMTRRIIKPQAADVWPADGKEMSSANGLSRYYTKDVTASITDGALYYGCPGYAIGGWCCPYGQPGDQLWVRETCRAHELTDEEAEKDTCGVMERLGMDYQLYGLDGVIYHADNTFREIENTQQASELWAKLYAYHGKRGATVPPIHMPRWASRILLEITNVRVERLQDISRKDAIAEGCEERNEDGAWLGPEVAFCRLWESINGPDSWEANPWVWVVEFKRIAANTKEKP